MKRGGKLRMFSFLFSFSPFFLFAKSESVRRRIFHFLLGRRDHPTGRERGQNLFKNSPINCQKHRHDHDNVNRKLSVFFSSALLKFSRTIFYAPPNLPQMYTFHLMAPSTSFYLAGKFSFFVPVPEIGGYKTQWPPPCY